MNNIGKWAVGGGQQRSRRSKDLDADRGRAAGFTLVELLVVLAIVATLLSLAVPRYFQHVDRSKEAVLRENLATMRDAIDQYHADVGQWPGSLDSLVERRYLRALPKDPVTESDQTWQEVAPEDGTEGIRDVRSGAEGTALDGSPYADW
ncbi:MAG: prepilin-type N-terminal cleavage/methylation domain-containing protein [Thiobacillus sp.]|nr:prepilin-type N-terminal cleavage/methylation domain-containing protein [Thiobacillus sp.]